MFISAWCPSLAWPPSRFCPNGPVSFLLEDNSGGSGGASTSFIDGFPVSPCDSVTWDFGDGTTQTVTGQRTITHNYPAPENYTIRATISNSLGGTEAILSLVIASSPSRVSYVPDHTIVANERDGSVTIDVERTQDLSRTSSVVARLDGQYPVTTIDPFSIRLTFAPGETHKSFVVPIKDDDGFSGPRYYGLSLADATGGTWTPNPFQSLMITEDDPSPAMEIAPAISIREGDDGQTEVLIPVQLSAAMLVDSSANVVLQTKTASLSDPVLPVDDSPYDVRSRNVVTIPAHTSSAMLDPAFIKGDRRPEPDEQFIVKLDPWFLERTNTTVPFGAREVLVTILNDDAAFLPEQLSLTTGTRATLKLDLGSPYSVPTTITFATTNEAAIAKPQPVTIPAGVTKVLVPIVANAAGNAIIRANAPDRTTQAAVILVTTPPKQRSARH